MRSVLVSVALAMLAGCTKSQPGGSSPPVDPPAAPTCTERLGLTQAKLLAPVKLPAECRPTAMPGNRQVIANAADALVALGCPANVDLGVDFATNAVLVTSQQLSPLGMGTDAVDDGAKVTFIHRERSRCPDEGGPPMPILIHPTFVIPKGSPRDFAEVSCRVELACR